MRTAHATAIVTWAYASGFGLPAPIVAGYLRTHGQLPSFFGLFDLYEGPWSARLSPTQFSVLLIAFLGVSGAAAASGWLLWQGRRSGAVLNLALLPVEAVFWIGFALPFPWLTGVARAVLAGASLRALSAGPPVDAAAPTARG